MRHEKGTSLLEVVIASAVGIFVVTALVFVTIFSLRNANFAKNSAQATKLAQEGLELVRTGRNRNSGISIPGKDIDSWSGIDGSEKAFWQYQLLGDCDRPDLDPPGYCYFNVNDLGELVNIGFSQALFPSSTEDPFEDGKFQRVVAISDDPSLPDQKTVTVIVRWTDAAGPHDSKLTTILRKL